jgi:hypothetical protein
MEVEPPVAGKIIAPFFFSGSGAVYERLESSAPTWAGNPCGDCGTSLKPIFGDARWLAQLEGEEEIEVHVQVPGIIAASCACDEGANRHGHIESGDLAYLEDMMVTALATMDMSLQRGSLHLTKRGDIAPNIMDSLRQRIATT